MKRMSIGLLALVLAFASVPALAQEDEPGCMDHPLFTRFPGTYLAGCESNQYDLRRFPIGQMKPGKETLDAVEVEGPVKWISYQPREGTTPPSGLQIMRNFENAAKKAGGSIEGNWPGWCKATYDGEGMQRMGNGCTSYALTMKFTKGAKETWVFLQAAEREGNFLLTISEREAMKQDVVVNELAEKLTKDGFISLYINFDTGKATIRPDSVKTLDDAAVALKSIPEMKVEVAGHTDNIGSPESNQRLSQDRAQAVMTALVQRGVKTERMTAKGYGQSVPVADNRAEEGRAKNRRVELVRK